MVRKPWMQENYDRGDKRIHMAAGRAFMNYNGHSCLDIRKLYVKNTFKRLQLI